MMASTKTTSYSMGYSYVDWLIHGENRQFSTAKFRAISPTKAPPSRSMQPCRFMKSPQKYAADNITKNRGMIQ